MQDKQDYLRPGLKKLLLDFFKLPQNADIAEISAKLTAFDQGDSLHSNLCACRDILVTEVKFDSYLNRSIYNETMAIYQCLIAQSYDRSLTTQEDFLFTGIEHLLDLEPYSNSFKM
jgi:hypothetical protein